MNWLAGPLKVLRAVSHFIIISQRLQITANSLQDFRSDSQSSFLQNFNSLNFVLFSVCSVTTFCKFLCYSDLAGFDLHLLDRMCFLKNFSPGLLLAKNSCTFNLLTVADDSISPTFQYFCFVFLILQSQIQGPFFLIFFVFKRAHSCLITRHSSFSSLFAASIRSTCG